MSMKIASWNVNSIKARLPHVTDWLESARPDVLALQETKSKDENFPREEIESLGYQVAFSGQPAYNGVALISRLPITDVVTDIDGLEDPQRRILAATIGGVRVLNLYVVNGKAVGSDKFDYKLHWLDQVIRHMQAEVNRHEKFVALGDFNITPDDRDVYDPEAWHEKILCSTPERAALGRMLDLGLADSFRLFNEQDGQYSWWDYRQAAFRRGMGMRIDLILISKALKSHCRSAHIDMEPRTWERPSDHTPVVAEFNGL